MEEQNSNDVRTVEIRSRPAMLTKTIASMTSDQKHVVKSMGFGGVLGLKLKNLSKDFLLFVIDQLDPVQRVIHTHNGDIPITRLAVHEVYGFPMGHKKFISRNVSNYNSELGELWKEHSKFFFGLSQISDRITKTTRCDRMFQLDFLILMLSLLISASKNNSCNREILDTLPVDFVCQEYDWCEYVLRTVETCKEDLKKHLFCGPSVFLLLLYCDRVSIALDPPVLRTRPVVAQWKNEDLQRRVQAESSGERLGLGLFLDEWKKTVEARDWRKQNVHFEECGCLSMEDDGHEMEDETGPSLQNTPTLEISHAAAATNLENSSFVEQFSELSVDAAGLSEYANDGVADAAGKDEAVDAAGLSEYANDGLSVDAAGKDETVPIKEKEAAVGVGEDEAVPVKEKEAAVSEAKAAKLSKKLKFQSKQVDGPVRRSERPKIAPNRYSPSEVKTKPKITKE